MNGYLHAALISFIILAAIVVCASFYFFNKTNDENIENLINIKQGLIKGSINYTVLNHLKYYSFVGIPYAKPPVGSLRFKDPLPAGPWDGVLDATKEGNECVQINILRLSTLGGNEDCLYLNVFTPHLANVKNLNRHPVMVSFHGGGFTINSGSPSTNGPGLLLEHKIVLVTLNYRLGAFGFLSVLTDNAPGNAGLKDQALALQWVNENIHSFGGDPYNVTIFGVSAGSASVQLHTLSQLSKGLFHRAIMESGSVLNPWSFDFDPVGKAFQLGYLLDFKGTDKEMLVDYLRTVPAYQLVKAQKLMIGPENMRQCIDFPFLPCAEASTGNVTFLDAEPRIYLQAGEFTKVPTIIGLNKREGIAGLIGAFTTQSSYGHDYGRFIPEEMELRNHTEAYRMLSNGIKDFYFHKNSIDIQHLDNFTNVCADITFTNGVYETIQYLIDANVPLYIYEFTFEGGLGTFKDLIRKLRPDIKILPSGAAHVDEVGYIFSDKKTNEFDRSSPEIRTARRMTSMWTNFAKHSYPYGDEVDVIWEMSTKMKPKYLEIGQNLTLVDSIFFPSRIDFWTRAFKKYHPQHFTKYKNNTNRSVQ